MLTIEDLKRELDPHCDHVFKEVALWDGTDKNGKLISSPTTQCIKCKGIRRFTHEEWKRFVSKGAYCIWGEHYVDPADIFDDGQTSICKECQKSLSSQGKSMKACVTLEDMIGHESLKRLEKSCAQLLREAFKASTSVEIPAGWYVPITWININHFHDKNKFFAVQFLAYYGLFDSNGHEDCYEITEKGKKVFNNCLRRNGEVIGIAEELKSLTKKRAGLS